MAAKEVSVHIRRQEPLVGYITATKRTSRPAGRHSRSRTLYWMTTVCHEHTNSDGGVELCER